jgi:RNA polymerase sigma-70 factor (ECF subfamily)
MSKRAEKRPRPAGPESGTILRFPAAAHPPDPAAVLERVISREPAAVAWLVDEHSPVVRQMLVRVLGDNHDVEDLVQETFLVVLRQARTLKNPSALRSFVVSVAIRLARNELRRRSVRRWVGLETVTEPPLVGGHDPVTAEQVRCLYRVLDRMDADSRLLFLLRYVQGLELTELAEVAACSLATLKRRLARAEARFGAIAKAEPALRDYIEKED